MVHLGYRPGESLLLKASPGTLCHQGSSQQMVVVDRYIHVGWDMLWHANLWSQKVHVKSNNKKIGVACYSDVNRTPMGIC